MGTGFYTPKSARPCLGRPVIPFQIARWSEVPSEPYSPSCCVSGSEVGSYCIFLETEDHRHAANSLGLKTYLQDSPGGPGVKNPPANARCTDSIPGLGRSHVPWGN